MGGTRLCGTMGGVDWGWAAAAVHRTTRLRAAAFGGCHCRAVQWAVLLGGEHRCDRQRGGTWWCIGQCCWGVGSHAMDNTLTGSGIWGNAAVSQAVLSGERLPWDRQDTMEAVGERRWCDRPRGGRGPRRLGTTRWYDGRCCWGRGGGATDDRGGCSGVFVFYLHMGMGEINRMEEGDPIIQDRRKI